MRRDLYTDPAEMTSPGEWSERTDRIVGFLAAGGWALVVFILLIIFGLNS